MVPIFETHDPIEVDVIKLYLEQNGIQVLIDARNVGDMRPSLSFVSPIRILVLETQKEDAHIIVKDFLSTRV